MYSLDWVEQLKQKRGAWLAAVSPAARISPVVWSLGFTSLLTDVSSEMVSSALPAYLVLHLRLSPLHYGIVDGIYNGFAVVLVGLVAGLLADRAARHKEVALAGYALSGICKPLMLAAGAAWGWIAAIIGLDRIGKGIRTNPRDALISLHTPEPLFASAFAVHRTLDAGGALLGPIIAFFLLAQLPGAFDVLWVTSTVFAFLGVAVLWLFVPRPRLQREPRAVSVRAAFRLLLAPRFRALVCSGLLLSAATISDGFIYLLLQRKGSVPASFFPLFYVLTACFYMLFAIPVGMIADRFGRMPVLLASYALLGILYLVLLGLPIAGLPAQIACLAVLGLYYAGTEGILVAMASTTVPAEMRTSGLALLATAVGLGKMASSFLFGWIWSSFGSAPAVLSFTGTIALSLLVAGFWLRRTSRIALNV